MLEDSHKDASCLKEAVQFRGCTSSKLTAEVFGARGLTFERGDARNAFML